MRRRRRRTLRDGLHLARDGVADHQLDEAVARHGADRQRAQDEAVEKAGRPPVDDALQAEAHRRGEEDREDACGDGAVQGQTQ